MQRRFFGTLFNTYNFFALYANLDGYSINQFDRVPREQLPELDRWISTAVDLRLSDVDILTEDIPGWLVASESGLTVALDVHVTDELRREGIARDFVNRIQNLRKDRDFLVTDKITIALELNRNIEPDDLLAAAIESNSDYIRQEVQAVSLELVTDLNGRGAGPLAADIEMDEFRLRLKVERV